MTRHIGTSKLPVLSEISMAAIPSCEQLTHHCVQNGSGAHSASYTMGTRDSFVGGNAVGA
jgi:hypothetical protein